MPETPNSIQNPTPQTSANGFSWSKVILTVVIIVAVVGIIGGAYWYLVLNKSESNVNTAPIKVSTPSAKVSTKSATASAKKSETADWKTFSDSKMGVSFKYPSQWLVEPCDEDFSVGPEGYLGTCHTENVPLIRIVQNQSYSPADTCSAQDRINTELGGETAVKCIYKSTYGKFTVYYIAKKKIAIWYYDKGIDYQKEFDQLVSTFKFL